MDENTLRAVYNHPTSQPRPAAPTPTAPPTPHEIALARLHPSAADAPAVLARAGQSASPDPQQRAQQPAPQPKATQATAGITGAPRPAPAPEDGESAASSPAPVTQVPTDFGFALPANFAVDEPTARGFATIADDLDLDGDTRQQLVDLAVAMQQRQSEAQAAERAAWRRDAERLPTTTLAAAREVFRSAPPAVRQLIERTGLGDHAEVIQYFASLRR